MKRWTQIKQNGILYNYEVSDHGDIRNATDKFVLKQHVKNGYKMISLKGTDKMKSFTVSRLVAEYYVDNKDNKNIVNHIDGNKINNHYTNLEWTTQKENIKHANENGFVKYNPKKVIQCDLEGNSLNVFDSVIDAAKHINLSTHAIFKVLRKKNQTAGGYKWKYFNEEDNLQHIDESELDDCKTINGYDNYKIFPDSRIYSISSKKFIKHIPNDNGYVYVTLCKKGEKKQNKYVHQIVAEHFIDNPDNKAQVNHKDYNKKNNHYTNLEWVTQSENIIHMQNNK